MSSTHTLLGDPLHQQVELFYHFFLLALHQVGKTALQGRRASVLLQPGSCISSHEILELGHLCRKARQAAGRMTRWNPHRQYNRGASPPFSQASTLLSHLGRANRPLTPAQASRPVQWPQKFMSRERIESIVRCLS